MRRLLRGIRAAPSTGEGDFTPRRWSTDSGQSTASGHSQATVHSTQSAPPQMRDALKCGICIEFLDEQFRVLQCGHSYCLKCLKSLVASKPRRQRGSIECPKCKQITNLPPEGVSFLQVNYDLKAVRDAIAVPSTNETHVERCDGRYQDCHTELENAEMNLNVATERYQKYLKANKDLIKCIDHSASKVESEINDHFTELVTVLEENKRQLLQNVKDIRHGRIKAVEEDRINAEKTIKVFKGCRGNLKKISTMKQSSDKHREQILACNETEAMVNSRPPEIYPNLAWMEYVAETETGSIQCGRLKTDRRVELQLENELGKGWLFRLGKTRGIAVTPRGMLAVAEKNANRVSVWGNENGEYQRKFCLKKPWYFSALKKPTDVAVTPSGKFIVADGSDTIKIFSASGDYDENEWLKEEGTSCVTCVPGLHHGNLILMDSGRNIARYDISEHILPPILAGTASHAIATNGKKVAISNFREVRVFDVDSGEKLLSFEARIRGLCFDDETKSILATTCDRQIGQYCDETGQRLAILSTECLNDPWGLAILPGRRLAVADDQTVKIYRINDN